MLKSIPLELSNYTAHMQPTTSSPAIPLAIIVGFAFIAIAVYFGSGREAAAPRTTETTNETVAVDELENSTIRPVDETDYIYGNPNAPIMIVEYSDYECPFCKQFHQTMNQVMDQYGVSGRVAWTYRQFPIPQLHPNATEISEAALCVGDVAEPENKNQAFWEFSDIVFSERGLREYTNMTRLDTYAERAGVDVAAFRACRESDRMQPVLEAEMRDAFNAGIRSTPYSVIMFGNETDVIDSAADFSTMNRIIQALLDQLDGLEPPATPEANTPSAGSSVIPAP